MARSLKSHGHQGREWSSVVNTGMRSKEKRTKKSRILEVLATSAESTVTVRRGIQAEGSEEGRKEDKPG